ncbi:hypothetical protein [Fulvivirga lutea]|uniref:Uncharacterized protein n=1 Tax=Fulvivirga lutea TaxID=2810512 RepID=A0A974WGM1_9BACT|nr:hypothetical protein [Fulvivirga lutea]QSE97695.1 hypothetical protein JR347_00995 [Fulvivirga lutea]
MKRIQKLIKLIGFIIILCLASIGLGFNAAILPNVKRQDSNENNIELVENKDEESETQDAELP